MIDHSDLKKIGIKILKKMSNQKIEKLKFVLGFSTLINLFVLYLGLLFLSVIEIAGLGTIPVIVSAMINPEIINNYVGFNFPELIKDCINLT